MSSMNAGILKKETLRSAVLGVIGGALGAMVHPATSNEPTDTQRKISIYG